MTSQKTLCQRANANILKNEEKGKSAHRVIRLKLPDKIIILLAYFIRFYLCFECKKTSRFLINLKVLFLYLVLTIRKYLTLPFYTRLLIPTLTSLLFLVHLRLILNGFDVVVCTEIHLFYTLYNDSVVKSVVKKSYV